jgi:hypothetical protein
VDGRRKAMRIAVVLCTSFVLLAGVCGAQKSSSANASAATANEGWQKEFEEVCSKTQDAMTFAVEQLRDIVQRCDALEPQIEKLDETRKKVYLKRLRQCRGVFAYVLESKQKEKK